MLTLLVVLLTATTASAQPPARRDLGDDTAFIESLRREDPDSATRFIALREAQLTAIEELERAQTRYNAGGPALRGVSLPALTQARRRYAEASLAVMDFLDARDRRAITRLQGTVERLTQGLAERAKNRADLERMLRE